MPLKYTAKGNPYYDDLTDEEMALIEEHMYSDELLTPTIIMRWYRLGEKRPDEPAHATHPQARAKDELD